MKKCRICYQDEFEVNSPLLNPCNCMGGLKYIHLSCLQEWIRSKTICISENEYSRVLEIMQIECEICKSILPDTLKDHENSYDIWEFYNQNCKNYLIMQSLELNENKKYFYVLRFYKDEIITGRKKECDLLINDISISRNHCIFKLNKDKKICLSDNNSKFGTLVQNNIKNIPLFYRNSVNLQIGRTLISAYKKRPFLLKSLLCCFKSKENIIDYAYLNSINICLIETNKIKIQKSSIVSINYLENNSMEKNSSLRTEKILKNNSIEKKESFNDIIFKKTHSNLNINKKNFLKLPSITDFNIKNRDNDKNKDKDKYYENDKENEINEYINKNNNSKKYKNSNSLKLLNTNKDLLFKRFFNNKDKDIKYNNITINYLDNSNFIKKNNIDNIEVDDLNNKYKGQNLNKFNLHLRYNKDIDNNCNDPYSISNTNYEREFDGNFEIENNKSCFEIFENEFYYTENNFDKENNNKMKIYVNDNCLNNYNNDLTFKDNNYEENVIENSSN
jgi:hypothetical protein